MMNYRRNALKVEEIVNAWNDSSLAINKEYQRGAKWSEAQMQGLVDSLFRRYPIPPFFLHEQTKAGLEGSVSKRFEIVDGQQRIRALADFQADKFPLLKPTDNRLRLPNSLRSTPATWGGRRFSELDGGDRKQFLEMELDTYFITDVHHPDEVRDLFIRLQSGTALSRQQIRDAWPGPIGPFVERLAGKLDRHPAILLFRLVDKRGTRNDDDRDEFDADRQFCAQLLRLYLIREGDIHAEVGVGANELDRLYHEQTDFNPDGVSAKRFEHLLKLTTDILTVAIALASMGKEKKSKFKKLDVIATFELVQDLSRNPNWKLDSKGVKEVANHLVKERETARTGTTKSTSGSAIAKHYTVWRTDELLASVGIRLDAKRMFDDDQKAELRKIADSKCAVCQQAVEAADEEYDHYPVPWAAGGRTIVENGRLVCKTCHPRGRAAGEAN